MTLKTIESAMKFVHSIQLFQTIVQGLTGEVKFDNRGYRTNFVVDVVELTPAGIAKIGTWNSTEGLSITRIVEATSAVDTGSLKNKTFIVLTALVGYFPIFIPFNVCLRDILNVIQSAPYGMLRDSPVQLTGNDRFEGFGIDLIHELSLMLGFNYEFRLQEDGVYGDKNNVTQEWNGMIRELREGVTH